MNPAYVEVRKVILAIGLFFCFYGLTLYLSVYTGIILGLLYIEIYLWGMKLSRELKMQMLRFIIWLMIIQNYLFDVFANPYIKKLLHR